MAAVMVAMAILTAATVMMFYTAQVILTDQKIFRNYYDKLSAENAAKAGFGYAFGYLNLNRFLVTDGLSFTGTLTNGSSYTVTYTYLSGNDTILISSVGKSADTASTGATRTVQAIVTSYLFGGQVAIPVVTKGGVSLSQTVIVTNNQGGATTTMKLAAALSIQNSPKTVLLGVKKSDKNTTGSDIVFDSSLASMSDSQFQTTYIGMPVTSFSTYANYSYNSTNIGQIATGPISIGGSQTAYSVSTGSSLNGSPGGVSGNVVYIDLTNAATQNISFNGGFKSGTSTSPTTFVVIGNVYLEGTSSGVAFNGNVYATGTVTVGQGATLTGFVYGSGLTINNTGYFQGAFVVGSNRLTMQNSAQVYIDSAIGQLLQDVVFAQYGVVPGSWKDF